MYKITFSDRSVLLVTTEQGDKIKEAQLQSNPPVYVDINNGQYKLDKINKLEYTADEPKPVKLIHTGPVTHEKSIHEAIYILYKKELQKPQQQRRRWSEFYPKAYEYLYSQSSRWCDYKRGTCVCEHKRAVERVKELMGGGEII